MHLVRLKCVRWALRWSKIVVFPRVNWKQHCIHVIIIINIIQNGSYICFKENLIGGSNALPGSYEDTSPLSSSSSSDWWLIIKYETFPGEGHILGGGSSSSNRRNTSDLQLSDRLISSTNTDGYVLLPRGEETCIHETIKDIVLAVCPTEHYQFHRFEDCNKCLAKKRKQNQMQVWSTSHSTSTATSFSSQWWTLNKHTQDSFLFSQCVVWH